MNDTLYTCRNCGKKLSDTDKYCKNCGTKRGEGKFKSRANIYAALYGPPYSAKYQCPNCGNTFIVNGLGKASEKFCPDCGTICTKEILPRGRTRREVPKDK